MEGKASWVTVPKGYCLQEVAAASKEQMENGEETGPRKEARRRSLCTESRGASSGGSCAVLIFGLLESPLVFIILLVLFLLSKIKKPVC